MDRDQKERLFTDLLPNIRMEAAKAARRSPVPREDLEQVGALAAWLAIDERFDESLGYKAWSYVQPRVIGAMRDYVRRRGHLLGNSRDHNLPRVNSLAVAEMVVNHRSTPQDELLAADSFWDLTRGNVLLHRVYQHGQERKEIAAEYGQPASTVGRRVKRALQSVRERIEGGK